MFHYNNILISLFVCSLVSSSQQGLYINVVIWSVWICNAIINFLLYSCYQQVYQNKCYYNRSVDRSAGPKSIYCNTFTSQVIDIRLTVFDLNIRPSNRNVPLGLRQCFRLWIKQIMLPSYPVNNCIINLKHRF